MQGNEWPAGRVTVLSPHFDDGVLSLGGTIVRLRRNGNDVRLITMFAGAPSGHQGRSARWDSSSGFRVADTAISRRRAEDKSACQVLGIEPEHLPFDEKQYRFDVPSEIMLESLIRSIGGAAAVFLPCGIGGHRDHVLCRNLGLSAMNGAGNGTRWYLYADLPYAWRREAGGQPPGRARPGDFDPAAGKDLADRSVVTGEPEIVRLDAHEWDTKLEAVLAYASQLAPLGADFGCFLSYPGDLQVEIAWDVMAGGLNGQRGNYRGRPYQGFSHSGAAAGLLGRPELDDVPEIHI